ncbi:HlyD family secretion protein [Solirhodobacter olei]|uniref:HlyD family secretion protein n=1 Tax=Solirhodobacter olei TaxID=2493082 RepID=UPI0013E2BF32|nr:HlyD family secretion protein [Solirhodobacter olei]
MRQDAPDGAEARGPGKEPPSSDEGASRSKDRSRLRRRRLLLFLVVVIALLGAGGGAWWYFYARLYTSTDDAFIDARIVRIAPQEPGRLVDVPIDSNTSVKPGQLLARIDPAAAKASYDQASAALSGAKAGVQSAAAHLEEAKAAIAQSESAYEAARITAENDQRTLDRLQGLKKSSGNTAVSQQQFDDARTRASSAKADAARAKTAVASAKASADAATAGVASANAQLKQAKAALEAAQVTLDHLTIRAPMAGQIVQLNVNQGSYVQPGEQIMALVPDHVFITANFKETELARIHPGDPVSIHVDAYPGVDFHGKVLSIQRGSGEAFQLLPPQNATGNYVKVVQRVPVRISIEGPDLSKYVLGPGMSVVPTVRVGQ